MVFSEIRRPDSLSEFRKRRRPAYLPQRLEDLDTAAVRKRSEYRFRICLIDEFRFVHIPVSSRRHIEILLTAGRK